MNLEGGKLDASFHPRWSTALCCLAAVDTNTRSQGCPSAASATATRWTRGSPITETSTLLPCYIQFLSNLFSPNVINCSSRFTGYFPKPEDTVPDFVLLEDCRKHGETASSQAFSWVLLLSKGQGTTEPQEGLQNHPKAGMGEKGLSDPHLQPGDPRSPAWRLHLQISQVLLTAELTPTAPFYRSKKQTPSWANTPPALLTKCSGVRRQIARPSSMLRL